jgi:WD40 repeat protein
VHSLLFLPKQQALLAATANQLLYWQGNKTQYDTAVLHPIASNNEVINLLPTQQAGQFYSVLKKGDLQLTEWPQNSQPKILNTWALPHLPVRQNVQTSALAAIDEDISGFTLESHALSQNQQYWMTQNRQQDIQLWQLSANTIQAVDKTIIAPEALKIFALSPEGQWLASGSDSGKIRLWTLNKLGTEIFPVTLLGHENAISTLQFSADKRWLASGDDKGAIRLWEMSLDKILKRACAGVGRGLTQTEWQRFMGDKPYRDTCEHIMQKN